MVQRRDGARFAFEPLASLGIVSDGIGQDLDGNESIQAGVVRTIDVAHPSRSDGAENLVGAQAGSGGQRHRMTSRAPRPVRTAPIISRRLGSVSVRGASPAVSGRGQLRVRGRPRSSIQACGVSTSPRTRRCEPKYARQTVAYVATRESGQVATL